MPKNWKYIKKLLEKEFLCEKLRGHITYDLTDYKPAPWYQQHFIMKYDDEILLEASQTEYRWDKKYSRLKLNWVQRDAIAKRLFEKYGLDRYSVPQMTMKLIVEDAIEGADMINAHHLGIFGVQDIIDAIGVYLHSDIEESLAWGQDDFITALAVLDRRCGKRRLEKYAGWDHASDPQWLRRIYQLRFEAEGISYKGLYSAH